MYSHIPGLSKAAVSWSDKLRKELPGRLKVMDNFLEGSSLTSLSQAACEAQNDEIIRPPCTKRKIRTKVLHSCSSIGLSEKLFEKFP